MGFEVGARLLCGSTLLSLELDVIDGTVCEWSGGSASLAHPAGVRVDLTPRFVLSYDEETGFVGLSSDSYTEPLATGASKILRCTSRFGPLVVLVLPALLELDD